MPEVAEMTNTALYLERVGLGQKHGCLLLYSALSGQREQRSEARLDLHAVSEIRLLRMGLT